MTHNIKWGKWLYVNSIPLSFFKKIMRDKNLEAQDKEKLILFLFQILEHDTRKSRPSSSYICFTKGSNERFRTTS